MTEKGKKIRVTIEIDENMTDEIISAYLKNPEKPQFGYYIDGPLKARISRQVVRKNPELVKARKQYVFAHDYVDNLRNNPEIHAANQAIWDKYTPAIKAAQKQGEEINKQANQHYNEANHLHNVAMKESDALFNAALVKAGITLCQYRDGCIQYVKPDEAKPDA